jgi:hypothetical protein
VWGRYYNKEPIRTRHHFNITDKLLSIISGKKNKNPTVEFYSYLIYYKSGGYSGLKQRETKITKTTKSKDQ